MCAFLILYILFSCVLVRVSKMLTKMLKSQKNCYSIQGKSAFHLVSVITSSRKHQTMHLSARKEVCTVISILHKSNINTVPHP